jgi:cytochrome bd-type quinol oxidase subunit 1
MSHDTLLDLSRWQWALTAAFRITFPAVTVRTSVLVVCLEEVPAALSSARPGGGQAVITS